MAMAPLRRRWFWLLLPAAALVLAGLALMLARDRAEASRPPVLLFTTLPLLWAETARMQDALTDPAGPHWALAVLGEAGPVRAIDALADAAGNPAMAGAGLLVMAQPRPLSPQENVALDGWVRAGGRVLLFADPMLTAHSAYPPGDPRRPQDIVLLSPILGRWGLELTFDEAQPPGTRAATILGAAGAVSLAGRFRPVGGGRGCTIGDDGLVARCRIERGRVIAVADAALLESAGEGDHSGNEAVLRRLLEAAGS